MTVETVANNGAETTNSKFSFDEGQAEVVLFDLGENSGHYFKPKSIKLGDKLTAGKVQTAFINDNSKLAKRPYVLEYKEPRAGSKGRGLIVYKNYKNGPRKQFGIINHWDSNIKLSMDMVPMIVGLAKHSVTRAMSDSELANDE